jgi:hypothetical protein
VRDGSREAGAQLVEAAVVGLVFTRHQIFTSPKPEGTVLGSIVGA